MGLAFRIIIFVSYGFMWKFPAGMFQKDLLHLLSNQIFRKHFENGEQLQLVTMETVIEMAINQV